MWYHVFILRSIFSAIGSFISGRCLGISGSCWGKLHQVVAGREHPPCWLRRASAVRLRSCFPTLCRSARGPGKPWMLEVPMVSEPTSNSSLSVFPFILDWGLRLHKRISCCFTVHGKDIKLLAALVDLVCYVYCVYLEFDKPPFAGWINGMKMGHTYTVK